MISNRIKLGTAVGTGTVCIVLTSAIAMNLPVAFASDSEQNKRPELVGSYERNQTSVLDDYEFPKAFNCEGRADMASWWNELKETRNSIDGTAETTITEWVEYLDDEQKATLRECESKIKNAISFATVDEYRAKFDTVVSDAQNMKAEEESAAAEAAALAAIQAEIGNVPIGSTYSSGGVTYEMGPNGVLTRSGGVNNYNGYRETWYSQRVLPGGGLNIPGRHIAADGTIRDADGYIVVASSDHSKGDTVDTSLGAGKVYDSGCASGTVDIYTDW